MITLNTIGRVRRAYFVQGRKIKAIARELKIARKTVRDVCGPRQGGRQRSVDIIARCSHDPLMEVLHPRCCRSLDVQNKAVVGCVCLAIDERLARCPQQTRT